jgi:hypothetical protein
MGARYICAAHHRHLARLGWNHCIDRGDHGGVLGSARPLVDARGGMSCRASRARMARSSVGSAAVIHASAAWR